MVAKNLRIKRQKKTGRTFDRDRSVLNKGREKQINS
jgi:hypothetical protein